MFWTPHFVWVYQTWLEKRWILEKYLVKKMSLIILLQWPAPVQSVLSLMSSINSLLPKLVVGAEELRGGWNKAPVLLPKLCLLQSRCFWLPFPSQFSVVQNFIFFSSCAPKWLQEILLLQAGNPGNSGSFQLAASQTDFQPCLSSLTWAIKSLFSSSAELKMANFFNLLFTSMSAW